MKNNFLLDKLGNKYLVKRLKPDDSKILSIFLNSLSGVTIKLFKPHSFDDVFIKGLLKNRKDIRLGLYTIKKKTMIGYAFVNKIPLFNIGYFGIGVSDEFQGRGLAPKLMSYLFYISKKEGIDKIILNVYDRNAKALQLYRKNGFNILKIDPINRSLLTIYEVLKNNSTSDLIKVFSERLLGKSANDDSFVIWMSRNF